MQRILITGGRAPVALELVRALGQAGHWVAVADSISGTLAAQSRYAADRVLLPSPRYQLPAFQRSLSAYLTRRRIDLVIPTCEEVFYLAQSIAVFPAASRLLCEPLPELLRWHHKGLFQRMAAERGLRTPRTCQVHSQVELLAALPDFPRYLLKPAFSRFASRIISNATPRPIGRLADCQPTAEEPWLLQEFVAGESLCSYSILHQGRVTAHCAYVTPQRAGLGAGSAFVSVDGTDTLAIVRQLAPQYSGQLSLDFIRGQDGQLYLLECNPRSTSGLHLLDPEALVGGLLDARQAPWLVPPGRRRQISLAALGSALGALSRQPLQVKHWAELGQTLRSQDVIFRTNDPRPALAQLPQMGYFLALSRRKRLGLLAATTDDIEWNGYADLHR